MTAFTWWMTFINTAFWLVMSFGIAYGVRLLPSTFYDKADRLFHVRPFEQTIYKRLRLHRWKSRLPEWGKVFHFEKKNLSRELTGSYVDQFILETKYAELGHAGIALLGFLCIVVNPRDYFQMALICAIVNAGIHIPFCLIQRYNRPRLVRLKRRIGV